MIIDADKVNKKRLSFRAEDLTWVLALFGTGVGAGVLFLPINAGAGGILPLLIVTVLAFPVTYFSHRAFARFCLTSSRPAEGIFGSAYEHLGPFIAYGFNIIFFLVVFVVLFLYSIALTNTVESFMIHQLGIDSLGRGLLSSTVVIFLFTVLRFGLDKIVKLMSYLVYPFIISLVCISFWLMPRWNMSVFSSIDSAQLTSSQFYISLWLIFPVLVMSFNHAPILSQFSVNQRKLYGESDADKNCAKIQKTAVCLMVFVVLLFVYSCVLSLTPEDLMRAKEKNISILSYLGEAFDQPLLAIVAPTIAFVAMFKSFIGHYIGAQELIMDLISRALESNNKKINKKIIENSVFIMMLVLCAYITYVNPNILSVIEMIVGPLGAMIILIFPMYAIHKVEMLKPYRNKISNVFITLVGIITVSAMFYTVLV